MAAVIESVIDSQTHEHTYWIFWCPGCQCIHFADERWAFNGDTERPTLTGSVLVRSDPDRGTPGCHLFVEEGRIRYLPDCTHELAGTTVPMVPIDKIDERRDR